MKILVNPCHGNAPYLMGANIAKLIGKQVESTVQVILPNIYGKRQENILRENELLDSVQLDHKLGEIYKPILFKDGDFSKFLGDITQNQEDAQKKLIDHVAKKYGSIDLEINIGSMISTESTIHYAFPVMHSELFEQSLNDGDLVKSFGESNLERALELSNQVEDKIESFFIPSYHTFSFSRYGLYKNNEVPTPPQFLGRKLHSENIPINSVYCIMSGTGSEVKEVLSKARQLESEGHSVIVSTWSGIKGVDKYPEKPVSEISHPNIKKVVGHAGWGTLWTCQVLNKDFECINYTEGDDPEIYFNLKTLSAIPLRDATDQQMKKFGHLDGIGFVANKIAETL